MIGLVVRFHIAAQILKNIHCVLSSKIGGFCPHPQTSSTQYITKGSLGYPHMRDPLRSLEFHIHFWVGRGWPRQHSMSGSKAALFDAVPPWIKPCMGLTGMELLGQRMAMTYEENPE